MPALDVFIYVKWKCLLSSVRICCSVKTLILLSHCIVLSSREHVKSSPLSFPLIMVGTEATLPGESWRELDVFASPVLTFGGCNSAEEVVVCDTKPPGIERCIMHRGQSRPMYVSPSELKILNYLLIPEKKLLLTWSYLQNFFGECWTLPYMSHLLVYFHYFIEVSTTSFSLRKETLKQPELVMAEYRTHRKEFLPCPPRKQRQWIEEIDLFKATKLRKTRFEGEGPFLTKSRVWAWSEP